MLAFNCFMMRKLQYIKKLRPILPVVIGLSLGISLNIIRMPISHEECVHLSKDSVDQKLHFSDSANNKVRRNSMI